MPARQLVLILIIAALAAALTITALFALGVPPLYVLLGAMAASVAVRFWSRRQ